MDGKHFLKTNLVFLAITATFPQKIIAATTPKESDPPPRAWRKPKPIVIAVIDTGVDVHHPDLVSSLWKNPGETGFDKKGRPKESNAIDDDRNGFIDDLHGWNFAQNEKDLTDHHGHGTHVSGIIKSVSPETKLMVIKYWDPKLPSGDTLSNTVAAINYAVKMGAQIINYSGGGTVASPQEEDAIRRAGKKGVLVVAAAGNEGVNLDQSGGFFPASYHLSNILSVAAHARSGRLTATSNFGVSSVDIAAPGDRVFSTLPGGKYGFMTGTSQATAYVSGTAALILKFCRGPCYAEEISAGVTDSGSTDPGYLGKLSHPVRIDSFKAATFWKVQRH